MTTPHIRRSWSYAVVVGFLVSCTACDDGSGGFGGASLQGQSVTVAAGATTEVCIELSTGGEDVVATQNDLNWDPDCLTIVNRCDIEPSTGKQLLSNQRGSGSLRAIVISLEDVNPIPDGALYCCGVRVDKSSGCCTLGISGTSASDSEGRPLGLGSSDGEVCVE